MFDELAQHVKQPDKGGVEAAVLQNACGREVGRGVAERQALDQAHRDLSVDVQLVHPFAWRKLFYPGERAKRNDLIATVISVSVKQKAAGKDPLGSPFEGTLNLHAHSIYA
jgi:hypothetical protein